MTPIKPKNSIEELKGFVNKIRTYPPAIIFFEVYGKKAKQEDRIKDLCEPLYRFCFPDNKPNVLGDFYSAFRDFEVLSVMGFEKINKEPLDQCTMKLMSCAQLAITEVRAMHRKDPLLSEYAKDWIMTHQEFNTKVHNLVNDILRCN